jgi:hypothetical protein
VIHAVHEDPKNPNLIYAGTEHGFFLSPDTGRHWIELKNNLPRVPVNDFVIHPRDNDLVLATHGRGVWILDNLSALQELTPQVLSEPAHLFALRPVEQIRYFNPKAHQGDMLFRGENPPAGAIIDYYTRDNSASNASLDIIDAGGQRVASLQAPHLAGIHRVIWNLRYDALPAAPADEESGGRAIPMSGPLVTPGEYTVRLTALGHTSEQKLQVKEDPRIEISPADRKLWTDALRMVADLYRGAVTLRDQLGQRGASAELRDTARELQTRIATLYRQMSGSTGRPTADQQAQMQFYRTTLDGLQRRAQ